MSATALPIDKPMAITSTATTTQTKPKAATPTKYYYYAQKPPPSLGPLKNGRTYIGPLSTQGILPVDKTESTQQPVLVSPPTQSTSTTTKEKSFLIHSETSPGLFSEYTVQKLKGGTMYTFRANLPVKKMTNNTNPKKK